MGMCSETLKKIALLGQEVQWTKEEVGLIWREVTKNKTHPIGKAVKRDTTESPTAGNTSTGAAHHEEGAPDVPHRRAGGENQRWFSFPESQHEAVSSPLGEEQRAALLTGPSDWQPTPCFPVQPRDYCKDSGMVLTTWVVSGAAGGEPKKVLVWFL